MKARTPSSSFFVLLAAVLLAAFAFLFYSSSLKFEFTNFDDDIYVYENRRVVDFTFSNAGWFFTNGYYRSYVPLTMISHGIDAKLWGMDARGHHLTNVILHAVNTVWLFLLVLAFYRLSQSKEVKGSTELPWTIITGALAGALIYSIHPMRAESVNWISDRKDLVCAFFLLPGVLSYLQHLREAEEGPKKRWWKVSVLLFIFAALSKTLAVMVPLILVMIDLVLVPSSGSWKKDLIKSIRPKLVFFVASLVIGIVATLSVKYEGISEFILNLSDTQFILLPFYSIAFYVVKSIIPVGLVPIYSAPDESTMFFYALLSIVIIASAIMAWKKNRRGWVAMWGAYAIFVLPTLGGLRAGIQPWADRYSYVATVPLVIGMGVYMGTMLLRVSNAKNTGRLTAVLVCTCAIVAMLGAVTIGQSRVWAGAESLWRHQIAVDPAVTYSYNNLGIVLSNQGNGDEAITLYRKGIGLKPDYAEIYNSLGSEFLKRDEVDSALHLFQTAIYYRPNYIAAHINLGVAWRAKGDMQESERMLTKALELNPESVDAYHHLAMTVEKQGKREEALRLFTHAQELRPGFFAPYGEAATILRDEGKLVEAITLYQRYLHRRPQDEVANYNVGCLYIELGDYDNAGRSFLNTITINPLNDSAYYNLGVSFGRQQKNDAAVESFQVSARLGNAAAQGVLRERGLLW